MRKLNICTWKSCKAIKNNLGLSIAFTLSAVWSFGAVLILLINFRYAEGTKTLDLNEIGDYLAGAFSPLAFGWLVFGYLMQNKELKLSRETQELQLKEYIKSVKEFENQTSVLEDQNKLFKKKEDLLKKSKNPILTNITASIILIGDEIVIKSNPKYGKPTHMNVTADQNTVAISIFNSGKTTTSATATFFEDSNRKKGVSSLGYIDLEKSKTNTIKVKTKQNLEDFSFLSITSYNEDNIKIETLYEVDSLFDREQKNLKLSFQVLHENIEI